MSDQGKFSDREVKAFHDNLPDCLYKLRNTLTKMLRNPDDYVDVLVEVINQVEPLVIDARNYGVVGDIDDDGDEYLDDMGRVSRSFDPCQVEEIPDDAAAETINKP